jgi:hypothetical protein
MSPTQYVTDNIHLSEISCMNFLTDADSKFIVIVWTLHMIYDTIYI